MNQPIVIKLFLYIINTLKPVILFIAKILCFPQTLILSIDNNINSGYYYSPYYQNYYIHQITLLMLLRLTQILVLLNFHVMLIFIYGFGLSGKIQICSVFILFNVLMFMIYYINNTNVDLRIIDNFIVTTAIHIIWMIIIICYILTFGSSHLLEFIIHPFSRGFILSEILKFGFLEFLYALYGFIQLFLMAAHIINPISLIRLYLIIKRSVPNDFNKCLLNSFLLIFLHDTLLLTAYILNWIFLIRTIKDHMSFIKAVLNDYNSIKLPEDNLFKFSFYIYLKNILILHAFKMNITYVLVFFLTLLNLIFIWKFKTTYQILQNFFHTKNLQIFLLDICLNSTDGLIQIFSPFAIIINYVNPIHLFSLLTYKRMCKDKGVEISFFFTHITFFLQKNFDILFTFFEIFKFFSPTFYLYLLYQKSTNEKLKLSDLFPLLIENPEFYSNHSSEIDYLSLGKVYVAFYKRRIHMLDETMKRLIEGFLTFLNILCILDVFSGMRMIKFFIFIIKFTKARPNERELINGFEDIIDKYNFKIIYNIKSLIINLFFYYPLSVLISILTPWNHFLIIQHSICNNYFKQIGKIKRKEIKRNINNTKRENYSDKENKKFFIEYLIPKFILEFEIMCKVLLLHVSLVRILILWKHFLLIVKIKMDKESTEKIKKDENNTCTSKPETEQILILRQESTDQIIGNEQSQDQNKLSKFRIKLNKKWTKEETTFFIHLCNNCENLMSNREVFIMIIRENFKIFIKELFLLPFIVILTCLAPWNIKITNQFLFSISFNQKQSFLWYLLKKTSNDYIVAICCMILILSVFKTSSILHLVYYSLRINLSSKDVQAKTLYQLYYKGTFKEEVFNMSRSIYSLLIILVLFILNILMITQILSTIRRTYRFIKREVNKDIYLIIKIYYEIFYSKKEEILTTNLTINDLSTNDIYYISQFLEPSNILNLGLTHKKLYLKSNVNLVWKFQYENYYKTLLIKYGKTNVLNSIDEGIINNYKSLCKELSQHTNIIQKTFTEEERDKLIGLRFALFEEFLNSLLRLPHLFLIPFKALGLIHIIIEAIFNLVSKLVETSFYKNYFKYSFYYEYYVVDEGMLRYFKTKEPEYEYYFYNLQIYFFSSVFDFLIFLILSITGLITSFLSFFFKLISMQTLRISQIELEVWQKKENLNFFLYMYQYILGVALGIIINGYWIYYFMYLPYQTQIDEIFRIFNQTENKFIEFPGIFFILEIIVNFGLHSLNRFWLASFKNKLIFIFGSYGLKTIGYTLLFIILGLTKISLKRSNVIIVDILIKFIAPIPKFDGTLKRILFILIFPFPKITVLLNKFNRNPLTNLILNIMVFFFVIYPFYLNFKVNLSILKFLAINVYSIINTMLILRVF